MGMLRAALALAVLLSHLPMATVKFASGGLAVQAFFIISGFYMTLVLGGKYADTRLFYTNRMLRIFPSYLVMLAIAAVIFLRPWRKRHRDTEHVPARLPGSNRGSGHGV